MTELKLPQWSAEADEPEALKDVRWRAGLAILSYGLRIGVRSPDGRFLKRLLPELPPLWKPSRSAKVDRLYSVILQSGAGLKSGLRHTLYADDQRVGEAADTSLLLDQFENNVQLYVAEFAPRRVFVHAGVVGWRGQAILIPGRSYSGKTTLTAALVRAGATYYSDEYAVIDEAGFVHPYPRRLAIREGREIIQTRKRRVEQLGGKAGRKPLPVGLVLVSRYKENAGFRPRRLSAGAGVLALLQNTVSIRRQPETALATMNRAVSAARVLQSARGEAAEMVEALLRAAEEREVLVSGF